MLVGVTRAEAYFAFNSEDVQYGIEADRRSKILRTYVRNTYSFHLNEILATIVNEYTDWERPIQVFDCFLSMNISINQKNFT